MEPLRHTEPQINRGYRLQFQFVHITAPKRALDGRQKAGLALGKPRCQSRPLRASTQRQGCSPACSQTDRHRSLKPSPAGAAQEQPKLVAPLPAPSQKSLSRAPARSLLACWAPPRHLSSPGLQLPRSSAQALLQGQGRDIVSMLQWHEHLH